eukprot:1159623-Pelagomonas_calceolata.AAC.4
MCMMECTGMMGKEEPTSSSSSKCCSLSSKPGAEGCTVQQGHTSNSFVACLVLRAEERAFDRGYLFRALRPIERSLEHQGPFVGSLNWKGMRLQAGCVLGLLCLEAGRAPGDAEATMQCTQVSGAESWETGPEGCDVHRFLEETARYLGQRAAMCTGIERRKLDTWSRTPRCALTAGCIGCRKPVGSRTD